MTYVDAATAGVCDVPGTASWSGEAPIGVFDSGLGGLTVVRRLREELPRESILYVADQAHVPYGGRELSEVRGFACSISEALLGADCKAVVMACNISSATALPVVRLDHPGTPVVGVISPGAQAAATHSHSGRIGVLATEGTVRTGAYTRALKAVDLEFQVVEVPCPLFVPLVESGEFDTPAAFDAARAYLDPLLRAGVDCVILGCTHYPFLLPALKAIAPALPFIDPAEETAREVGRLVAATDRAAPASAHAPRTRLLTTGDASAFEAQLDRFPLGCGRSCEIGSGFWESGLLRLVLPA